MNLVEAAATLGITCSEIIELGRTDRRILPLLDSATAFRLRRWLDADRPEGDVSRLAFTGADSVREVVCGVLRALPAPVRHYAIEAVVWIEVGRGTAAWMHQAPSSRALPGDVGHVIVINGRVRDEDLPGVVTHEVAHGFHRPIAAKPVELPAMSERDAIAARHVFAKHIGAPGQDAADREHWIRIRVQDELLADNQAAAWGIPHPGPNAAELRRHFAAQYDAAGTWGDEQWRNAEADAPIERAAAITIEPGEAR